MSYSPDHKHSWGDKHQKTEKKLKKRKEGNRQRKKEQSERERHKGRRTGPEGN